MSLRAIATPLRSWSWPAALESFAVPGWLGQQNSWVEDPKNSDSAAYNYPLLLRICGPLNDQALRCSLDEVVQRHATLRSVFEVRGTGLAQVVLGEHACPFERIDLSALDEAEREAAAREIVSREAETPFVLAKQIPFRALLLRMESEVHDLLIVTHHLAYDDWSNGILVDELSATYSAFAANQPSPLPDLPAQYGDFVRWSARRMAGQELAVNIAFWKSQLGDGGTFHHLPPDLRNGSSEAGKQRVGVSPHRPSRELKRGARETAVLPEGLTRSLSSWSSERRASIFMTLLGGFQSLLQRYSGDEEIAVGTCVANRPQMPFEKLIGRFGNHMVIRTNMAGNPSFEEIQHRVREASLTAYGYQEMPFGDVLRAVRPRSDARCDRVVQAMFVFQNAPKGAWQVPGLDVRWMPVKRATTRYDLTMWLRSTDGIEMTLEYNADLFKRATIRKVLNNFRRVLEHTVAHPSSRISEFAVSGEKIESVPPTTTPGAP